MENPDILSRIRTFEQLGWNYLYNDSTEQAQQTFEMGRQFAKHNNLPCWEILFQFYICQIYVYYTFNLEQAVDIAVRTTTRLSDETLQSCSERMFVYGILVHAYFYRDCFGYEDEIRAALKYIEDELPDESESQLRVAYIRAEMDFEYGRYQAVNDQLMSYFSKAEFTHPYRKADGCRMAHLVHYALGDFATARYYAEENEEHSYEGQHQRGVADALLWQAVYVLRLGQKGEAQNILQRAIEHYKRYNLPPALTYFDALCEYYEIIGDTQRALSLREKQFTDLHSRGSLHDLAKAHLQYCRLLGRLDKELTDAVAQAREFLKTLKKPAHHEAALKRIESGDYFQFDWQRPNSG